MSVCAVLSHFSHVWLFVPLWTAALQAPLSTGFPRQEYWCGFPCPPPDDLPDLGIKPGSLTSPALAGRFSTTSAACIDHMQICTISYKGLEHPWILVCRRMGGGGWHSGTSCRGYWWMTVLSSIPCLHVVTLHVLLVVHSDTVVCAWMNACGWRHSLCWERCGGVDELPHRCPYP